MNRLYVAESRFSLTGAMADHRRRATHTDVVTLAVGLARELGLLADDAEELAGGAPADSDARRWLTAVARDLTAHRGRSLVIAGPRQPAAVQALAFWMNEALGNVGRTVMFSDRDASTGATQFESMPDLAAEMASGDVTTLVMIGGNPAFDGPADLGFANLLMQTPTTIRLGVGHNETSALSEWVLPAAHDLEAWGDGRAVDGSVTLQQPMIQPLYDGRSAAEFLALLGDYPDRAGYDIGRTHWQAVWGAPSDDRRWRRALHDGVVAESAHPTVEPDIDTNAIRTELAALANRTPVGIQLSFYPAASVYDGRFANNGWLQETPDPMTKLTWDNAALLSPATARDLDVAQSDLIEIDADGRSIEMPVLVQPGHADDAVSLFVGYGRTAAGRVGIGVGHNVYPLRTTDALWHLPSATLRKTGRRYLLACTQDHHSMEGRPIVREVSVGESLETSPGQTSDHAPLYHRPTGNDEANQWGMAIDLNTCIGCNACVVACQAENNIPIVGKVEVANGREMQWIRLDRYYVGDENDPQAVTQPVACQHCENAPCETVCPVAATVHSPEGLNDMIYNRCVGTRYCANNCPYKVRRFNYLDYHGELAETEKMAFNPNVTIRMRGVMEKCTYCVQRIQEAKITARTESRDVKDGEIKTACQQTCPAEAIVFGNIADPESQVARLRSDPRTYSMLDELNTKPRTTYLAKARNPNPELVADG